jgi:hypothetical protein
LVNLAVNSNQYRDSIIEEGGINGIIELMDRFPDKKQLSSAGSRALSKIVRGQPIPTSPHVANAIRIFGKKLKKGGLSRKAILASCWALADHASKDEHIQILFEEETFPSILKLLK